MTATPSNVPAHVLGAFRTLLVDRSTVDILSEFGAAGIRAILLKGPSTTRWLYEKGERRPYVDCDLLVDPADSRRAEAVLSDVGFVKVGQRDRSSEHSTPWVGGPGRSAVDLHRTLPAVRLPPTLVWEVLSDECETLAIGGRQVEVLSPPARGLHLALHAIQHGIKSERTVVDLVRAVERVDREVWRAAARLAERLEVEHAFAAGLRLVPEGALLADELGLPADEHLELTLAAASAPAGAGVLARLERTPGMRQKILYLGDLLIPPPGWMRGYYPLARSGRAGLAAAYAWRVALLMARLPHAVRVWRAAVRKVGTS